MKRVLSVFIVLLILIPTVMNGAALSLLAEDEERLPSLLDAAGLLDENEAVSLSLLLEDIGSRRQCEVAVVTVDSLEGYTAESYADDIYDYCGYGIGPDRDGILLLLAMGERKWHITTRGYGITAFTDYGLELIEGEILPYLSDGEYYDAFTTFAEICDDYIGRAQAGEPVDISSEPESLGVENVILSIIIGFVVALIATGSMKSKLTSVRPKNSAADYTVGGSFKLTDSRDIFLYKNVTRTARPRDTGSSGSRGGSSTHTSSSGSRHGGRGGSF